MNAHLNARFGTKTGSHARQISIRGGSHREETIHSGGELLLTSHIAVLKGRENTAARIVKDLNAQFGQKLSIRQVQRGHIVLEGQVTAQQGHRQGGAANYRAGVLIHAGRVVARQGHANSGRNGAVNTGKTAVSKHARGGGLAQGGGCRIQITHQV